MAGIKPEMLGRKAFSDRDVAARDTVYRKPPARAARKETTSSTKKSGGGGSKKSGGGRPKLPQSAPIPTPRPNPNSNLTLGGTPTAGYEPSVASQLAGVPPDLQDATPMQFPARPEFPDRNVMQTPSSAPGFAPTQSPTSVPGMPTQSPTSQPGFVPTQSPTSQPGPQWPTSPTSAPQPGRDELAALLKPPMAIPAAGIREGGLPGESWMNQKGDQILPEWLTRLMGRTPTQ